MDARTQLPKLGDRIALGTAGLSVSPICLGMVRDPDVVLAAFDAGINFFFVTADMHWPFYEQLRRGLEKLLARGGGIRERLVVAGVSYVTQPEFCEAPFEEILMTVPALERLDVLVMGGTYGPDFQSREPIYRAHRDHAFCGARAIGASFHDRVAAAQALVHERVDLAFIRYNPLHIGARSDLFPALPSERRGKLFNFKSTYSSLPGSVWQQLLPQGGWRPELTDYYRYALTRPELDGLLVSLGHPSHVEGLARALERGPLGDGEQRLMEAAAAEVARASSAVSEP